ncbi:MAG: DUF2147 domain-containing protein [Betaproteobacteria bacterium]
MTRLYGLLALALSAAAQAQMTPVGSWHSIDDATGKPKAEIVIRDSAGVLSGKVERSLQATGAEPLCNLCTDDRKGQPKIGMEIIRGAQRSGADAVWEGGTILDPENGKVYKLRLTPQDGGKTLQVRGYIGPFFRTQVWQRVQ